MKKLPKDVKTKLEEAINLAAEAAEMVQEARDQGQEYLDDRSDKWKEEHEGDYEDFLSELDNIIEALTAVQELSSDVEYGG